MIRCWPLPKYRDGRHPVISDGYHTKKDIEAGRATREHLGVDIMYRRVKSGKQVLPNLSKHFECLPDTPALATGAGLVAISREDPKGGYILIDHGDGTASQYMHLAVRAVVVGTQVFQGVIIGLVGFNTQPGANGLRHLHFQYRRGYKSVRMTGLRVNPEGLMKGWEVLDWPL